MSNFDDTGIQMDSFEDIVENLENLFKTSFGDNLKLSADSVTGQLIRNYALSLAELNEIILAAVDAFTVEASGAALSKLALLNGISRNPPTKSYVTLTFSATAAVTVPEGTKVRDVSQNEWETTAELDFLAAGSDSVTATCTIFGPTEGDTATITELLDPISQISWVTNSSPAVIGLNEETDGELRARRARVSRMSATTSVSNIVRILTELENVNFARVLENVTSSTDANGIPPHSILCIVDGGDEDEIAENLFSTAPAGVGLSGSTTVNYNSTITGQTHEIKFSRPVIKNVYIDVEVLAGTGFPTDGAAQIKEEILLYFSENLGIGDSLIYTRLYTPINAILGHQINSLFIDITPSPALMGNITASMVEILKTEDAFISVTVV